MKHLRRKTAFILLGLIMFSVIAFFYINQFLIPIKLKQYFTTKLHTSLNREVEIQNLKFSFIKGFIFNDIIIYQKINPHKYFATIKEVSFNILLTPSFKNKKIIIPSVTITKPFINLHRYKDKTLNISNLFPKKTPLSKDIQILIGKITLENGSIDYIDEAQENIFRESLREIDLIANISPFDKSIKFNTHSRIPSRKTKLYSEGEYKILQKKLHLTLKTIHFALTEYLNLFNLPSNILLQKGIFSSDDLEITYHKKKLNILGSFYLKDTEITFDKQSFKGNIFGDISNSTYSNKNLSLLGDLTLKNTLLNLDHDKTFHGDIAFLNIQLTQKEKNISAKGQIKITDASVLIGEKIIFKGFLNSPETTFTWTNDILNLQSKIQTEKITLHFPIKKTFSGSPQIDITLKYNPAEKVPLIYQGILDLYNAQLTEVPIVSNINRAQGKILFQNNLLKTENLTFKTQDSSFQLTGSLTDFSDPELNIKLFSSNIDIPSTLTLFPEIQSKLPFKISGTSSLKISYIGKLLKPKKAIITASTQLKNITLSDSKLPENITEISGNITYKKDFISWENLTGTYHKKTYTFNGELNNFSRPIVTSDIISEKISLKTKINILRNAFRVVSLSGNILNSSFDTTGDVHFFDDAQPDLDFRTTFSLDTEESVELFPFFKKHLNQIKPKGIISGEILFRGKPQGKRLWGIALEAEAPSLSLFNYPFKNINIQLIQRDQHISKGNFSANIYTGELSFISSADLIAKDIPVNAQLQLKNIDLRLWKKNQKIKNQDLAGKFSIASTLTGSIKNISEITGKGSLSITDGYLGRLIKVYPNAFFTDAVADFDIRNQKMITKRASLFSQVVDLNIQGWLDIHQNINLDIVPSVGKVTISGKKDISIDPSFLLREAISLSCTGTIQKPQCKKNASPIKIIENTSDFILETIGSVLEELF